MRAGEESKARGGQQRSVNAEALTSEVLGTEVSLTVDHAAP